MLTCTIAGALVLALVFATAGSADELAGLWKAKKRFGPDAPGTLLLLRSGGTWTADMAGRILPVAAAKGELTFTLPDGGTFRGKLDAKGVVHGHWLRPGTPVNGADRTTPVAASPVTLKPTVRIDGAAPSMGRETRSRFICSSNRSRMARSAPSCAIRSSISARSKAWNGSRERATR